MRFTLLLFVVLLSGAHSLSAQETVDTRGITSEIKLEEVIFGHLTELNDKFKLRATELTLRCTKFRRDRSEADMPRASEAGRSDENDP